MGAWGEGGRGKLPPAPPLDCQYPYNVVYAHCKIIVYIGLLKFFDISTVLETISKSSTKSNLVISKTVQFLDRNQ